MKIKYLENWIFFSSKFIAGIDLGISPVLSSYKEHYILASFFPMFIITGRYERERGTTFCSFWDLFIYVNVLYRILSSNIYEPVKS